MHLFQPGFSQIIPLYAKNQVPNAIKGPDTEKRDTLIKKNDFIIEVSNPTLTAYLPKKELSTGTAIIICPGGSYKGLAIQHEGHDIAIEFNKMGIAAFVLKYRLPSDKIMVNKEIGPLQDAQQAIKIIRQHSAEWNIDSRKVGIIGFSAGGHLASTAGTHFNVPVIENNDKINLRPDFMILIYPVISFADSITHKGSKTNLIGATADINKVNLYSNELQVSSSTPPTFLVHAQNDKTVSIQNSLFFYQALIKKRVSAEAHFYPKGGHGFGLNNTSTNDKWIDSCKNWLAANNFITN